MNFTQTLAQLKKIQGKTHSFKLPEKVRAYTSPLNVILMILVLWSGYYVVDLSNSIKRETQVFGQAQEEEIRLNQDFAELQYEHSQAVDAKLVSTAAKEMNMYQPADEDVVILPIK